jgi:hypothetical protein
MKEVLPLHSGLPWLSSDEHDDVGVIELFLGFVAVGDLSRAKDTDLRRGKLQSSSSRATPFMTLRAGVMSRSLRLMETPGKMEPLQS